MGQISARSQDRGGAYVKHSLHRRVDGRSCIRQRSYTAAGRRSLLRDDLLGTDSATEARMRKT